jgi:hypothetical protein
MKPMKFFRTIRDSVYNPIFYRQAIVGEGPSPIKYFFKLIATMSIVVAISSAVSFFFWFSVIGGVDSFRSTALSLYPDALVLEYRDGHVTSNVDEPYLIPIPDRFKGASDSKEDSYPLENLLVIDTTHAIAPEDLAQHKTAVILGGDALWYRDSDGIQVDTFASWKQEPFTVDRQMIGGLVDKIAKVLIPVSIVGFVLLPLIFFFAFSFGYLFYLLFGALIILIVAKIRKIDITYVRAYKVGLFLITAPIAFGLLRMVLPVLNVPFLFSVILAGVAYANLAPADAAPVVPEGEDTAKPGNETPEVF